MNYWNKIRLVKRTDLTECSELDWYIRLWTEAWIRVQSIAIALARISQLSTADWTGSFFVVGTYPVRGRMYTSIPGLFPADAYGIILSTL